MEELEAKSNIKILNHYGKMMRVYYSYFHQILEEATPSSNSNSIVVYILACSLIQLLDLLTDASNKPNCIEW